MDSISLLPESTQERIKERAKNFFRGLKSVCKKCDGEGYIVTNRERGLFKDCPECTDLYFKVKPYLMANIPEEYISLTLEDVSENYDVNCFEAYSKLYNNVTDISKSFSLLFHKDENNYSWGVTTSGLLILKKFIDLGKECHIVNTTELIDAFFSFGENKEENFERERSLKFYLEVNTLMIDNFGDDFSSRKENGTGFLASKIVSFLNARKMKNRFTVICTNMPYSDFEKRYVGSILSFTKEHFLGFAISSKPNSRKRSAVDKLKHLNPDLIDIFAKRDKVTLPGDSVDVTKPSMAKKPKAKRNILDSL